MPSRPGLRSVLPVFVLLLVAACGGPLGAPRPDDERAQATTAASILGDLRTVDPCSLVTPAHLAALGEVTPTAIVSLDYCLLHVRTSDGSLVQLATGELGVVHPDQNDRVTRRGSVRLVREAPVTGHCARQVLFADGIAIRVSADLLSGDPAAGLCGIADAGAESTLVALKKREVRHREFPVDSLALVDPCAVLDSAIVRQVPGLENAKPRPSPSRHQCHWGQRRANTPRIQLIHTAGAPPRVLHGAAVEEDVAGRPTVISVVGGDPKAPLCSAETAHIPFGTPNSGQTEVAMLVVVIPGANGIRACEFARGLAEHAWPRLPG